MMFEEGEYYSPSEELMFSCINSTMPSSKMKKMMANKKRFSDEQVKSLESIFENDTKLESKKKAGLARELGLQPRQVAIWFQNKRARYKSKKLERDYSILMANYNALASEFDSLKKEKHDLFVQVQKLRDLAGKCEEANSNYTNRKSDKKYTEIIDKLSDDHNRDHDDEETKHEFSIEGAGSEYGASSILSDEGSICDIKNFSYNEIMKIVDPTLTVDQSIYNLDDHLQPNGLFDDQLSDGNCQWWDFWS